MNIINQLGAHYSSDPVTQSNIAQLKKLLIDEIEYSKKIYPEIQFRSDGLQVSGVGIKNKILTHLSSCDGALLKEVYKEMTTIQASNLPAKDKEIRINNQLNRLKISLSDEEKKCVVLSYKVMKKAQKRLIFIFVHEGL